MGYFDSKSLSTAAVGVKNFILNNGKMQIVCGAELSENDVEAIITAEKTPEEVLANNFLEDLDNLETNIQESYVDVLSWMIANDLLDIKVAIKLDENGYPYFGNQGILHLKVGIFKDTEGNYITINGSNNETAYGWDKNFENFDVFKGWDFSDYKRTQKHIKVFKKIWDGNLETYDVLNIPDAVKKHLIGRAPRNIGEVIFIEDIPEDVSEDEDSFKPVLYDYQIKSREEWFNHSKRGIFSMATGTGKTYTALGCVEKLLEEESSLVCIISSPQLHLVQQWKKSVESFGLLDSFDEVIIVDTSNSKGKDQFKDAVYKVDMGYIANALILTTHDSLCSEKFYSFLFEDEFDCTFLLIGDEMHGLGSYTRKNALIPQYKYRLGLSATPRRQYDDEGTDFLFSYFGDEVYSFPLERALTEINPATDLTYLTPYKYYPYFFELNDQELRKFKKLTKQIIVESNKDEPNKKKIENLIFDRADILKDGKNKYDLLRTILNDMDEKRDLLVYCDENQIEKVVGILGNEFNLDVKTFTAKDEAKAKKELGNISKREFIIKFFAGHNYDCLVAMHCLDEGVDIPTATRAILMCNSTNPREFIQRVGRVIRRHDDKDEAEIYDMIFKPSSTNSEFRDIEKKLFNKELVRSDYIGSLALNSSYYYTQISKNR